MTDLIVCPSCKKLTRYNDVHTCYDFDALERVREAERKVIEAAVKLEGIVNDTGWSRGLGCDCTVTLSTRNGMIGHAVVTELLDAVRALSTGHQGGA